MLGQLNSKASIFSLGLAIVIAMFSSSILSNSTTFNNYSISVLAQPFIQTVKSRDLVIDLGNGITTNAQLTLPAVGNGPFPGVLLIQGTGPIDMNETISPDVKPFWQIAQYLSERGFAVLRYDKRGVGANSQIIDYNVWGNLTFDDLKNDATKALNVLTEQPEVDPNKITLIGHSEGTVIIPRVVIDLNSNNNNNNSTGNLTKVANIVLMGTGAQNLIDDISHFQVIDNPMAYAHQVLDKNHTGSFSVQQPIEHPNLNQTVATYFGNSTTGYVDIENELKPVLEKIYENFTSGDTEAKCSIGTCPRWIESHEELEPNLSVIGNVSESTSILMMNGENDSQSTVQQAFLLEQRLTEVNHPDHTLITYPDLGHLFSPSSPWFTEFGPIEEYVLSDLHRWLSDRTHGMRGILSDNRLEQAQNNTVVPS
jgi:pimeloyl-ACP methyl ester carboxylesterase